MSNQNQKKKKFNQTWSNQTELGKKFGISAIAVGKLLIESGLKDSETNLATEKALNEGCAKSTPLKNGTPYFMWNIENIYALLSEHHTHLSDVDYWTIEIQKRLQQFNKLLQKGGEDKIAYMLYDNLYYDVPKNIRQEVKLKAEPEVE